MRKILLFLIFISLLNVGCLSFLNTHKYTYEELQRRYLPTSEEMFWIERYGVPDEIEERGGKIEVFYWNKGKEDAVWIQFENGKATFFSFL